MGTRLAVLTAAPLMADVAAINCDGHPERGCHVRYSARPVFGSARHDAGALAGFAASAAADRVQVAALRLIRA